MPMVPGLAEYEGKIMRYKIFSYELTNSDGKVINPDNHYKIFESSRGTDAYGQLTEYRGKPNTVLMHLKKYGSDFSGLIGRHSTERDITIYSEDEDETITARIDDNDYPNTPFICMPRLGYIACVEGKPVSANSAMSRLHAILEHRQKSLFVVTAFRTPFDLRKAVEAFRVTEVVYEIHPVNPHTGIIGQRLDDARKQDNIKRLKGTAEAPTGSSIKLDGGFITAIQQLQQSGHAKAGFTGVTDDGVEIKVPKPTKSQVLSEDYEDTGGHDDVDATIVFPSLKYEYPFQQAHVTEIRKIARSFKDSGVDNV